MRKEEREEEERRREEINNKKNIIKSFVARLFVVIIDNKHLIIYIANIMPQWTQIYK